MRGMCIKHLYIITIINSSLKSINKIAKEEGVEKAQEIADIIIKNTYRTRGMKGCYVYCTDKKLSNYLKNR